MPLDPERRVQLLGAKLSALVAERWGTDERTPSTFPRGTALHDGGGRGWVLPDGASDVSRTLGPALFWAARHDVTELHLLVDDADEAAALARRAGELTLDVTVWSVDGRPLVEAAPAPPPVLDPPLPPEAEAFVDVLRAAGAEPVAERGVLVGEVLGLEVARVVVDEDGAFLEVGVGKHDRHAQSLLHGDRPPAAALADAVAFVASHRRPGAAPHPLNRLAPERWLRSRVVADPSLVGAAQLWPVSSPVVRDDLRKSAPAPAAGTDASGAPLLVVCSTGIDLDLVPAAADARLRDGRGARLLLAIPRRDDLPVTRALAAALTDPAEVVPVPENWRALTP